jgi:hypothetical protein
MSKAVFITHPLFGPGASTPADPEWSHNWAAPGLNFQHYMRMIAWAITDEADGGAGVSVISWSHHWLIHTQGLIAAGARQGSSLYLERDKALLAKADELWVGGGQEAAELSAGTREIMEAAKALGIPVFSCVHLGDPGQGSGGHDRYELTPWEG